MTAAWFTRAGLLVSAVEATDASELAELLIFRLACLDCPDAIEVDFAIRYREGSPPLALVWLAEPQQPASAMMCSSTARLLAARIREDERFASVLTAPSVLAAQLDLVADQAEAETRAPSAATPKVLHS